MLGSGHYGSIARCHPPPARAAPRQPDDLAGHSLSAGLATAAGVSERAIMAQTGHRSLATPRNISGRGSLFLENAATKVGL